MNTIVVRREMYTLQISKNDLKMVQDIVFLVTCFVPNRIPIHNVPHANLPTDYLGENTRVSKKVYWAM